MESRISKEEPHHQVISFLSLGMVVLDELRFPGRQPLIDVLGGSGAYSTLGARLFAEASATKSIGCLVLAGNDFPQAAEDRLLDWEMSLIIQKDADRLYIRPLKFKYITDPLKSSPADVRSTILLQAQAFHFLATPSEIQSLIPTLLALRQECGIHTRPLLIWEPFPAACKAENRDAMMNACRLIDVFSPNHLEMSALFSQQPPKVFQPDQLEAYARTFLDSTVGPSGQGYVVIRAAEHGCLVACRSEEAFTWFPAFYAPQSTKVKDPTGAGNAFLGGFAIGLQQCNNPLEAATYGTVAASFALEQIGLPCRDASGEKETWNGHNVQSRLQEYRARLRGERRKS